MGLFNLFKKKSQNENKSVTSLFNNERRYIYFYGSDMGAANVRGNVEVIDNIPHIITDSFGGRKRTNWNSILQQAKDVSLPTYFWLKNINKENWQQYAITFHPSDQPKDIDFVRVFNFPNSDPYSNPVDSIVVGKHDKKIYIRHSLANGHSGHDSWIVSVSIPITYEDVRLLATELNLQEYVDIDENNWIDKIHTAGASNVYNIPEGDTIFDTLKLLEEKNIEVCSIEYISIFGEASAYSQSFALDEFYTSFKDNWRMYSFKIKCRLTDSFNLKVDGLTKEALASWPTNIVDLLK